MYNSLSSYLMKNNLLSSDHTGFRSWDSCINQFLSTTHEIHSSFSDDFEVRGVFLDISKIFDKV